MVKMKTFVGIMLIIVSLLISGCYMGSRQDCNSNIFGDATCYGGFAMLQDTPANAQYCLQPHYQKESGLCLLKQTPTKTCPQLMEDWQADSSAFSFAALVGNNWPMGMNSVEMRHRDARFCVPLCSTDSDCQSEKCYNPSGFAGFCTPSCSSDSNCIEGITTCEGGMCVPTSKGEVMHYGFDEINNRPGMRAVDDLSGRDYRLQLFGWPSINDGVFTSFGTITDYLRSAGPIGKFPTRALTAMFWMRAPPEAAKHHAGLISYAVDEDPNLGVPGGADETARAANEFLIFYSKNSGLKVMLNKEGMSTASASSGFHFESKYYDVADTIYDDNWHHVAVTWRNSIGIVDVYVDGTKLPMQDKRRVARGGGRQLRAGGTLVVGQEQDSKGGGFVNSEAFIGQMDEVRLYDYAMSANEIRAAKGSAPQGAPVLEGSVCTKSGGSSGQFVLSEMVPASSDYRGGCCNADQCFSKSGTCQNPGFVSNRRYICEDNNYFDCKNHQDIHTAHVVGGKTYTCNNNAWEELIIPEELFLHYDFETPGAANDRSGKGNDGVVSNQATVADGVLNLLGNTNSYVAKENFAFPTDAVTVMAWINHQKAPRADGIGIVSYAVGNSKNANEFLLEIRKPAGANPRINTVISDNRGVAPRGVNLEDTQGLIRPGWNHVASTWQKSDGQLITYVNGQELGRGILQAGLSLRSPGSVVVGQDQDKKYPVLSGTRKGGFQNKQAFQGQIDDVRVYNYVMDAEQVFDTAFATRPVAHFNFDEQGVGVEEQGGVTWEAAGGVDGGAYLFDGEDDGVQAEVNPLRTDFTLSAWIKPTEWQRGAIFSSGELQLRLEAESWQNNGQPDGNQRSLTLLLKSGGQWFSYNTPANSIRLGSWNHVAVSFGGDDGFKVYINGEAHTVGNGLVKVGGPGRLPSNTIGNPTDQTTTLRMGTHPSYKFKGFIDEVKIFANVLTDEQLVEVYAGSSSDTDGDGIADGSDNCPTVANEYQTDGDEDGVGDVCDNCPVTANSGQLDSDQDGSGDACPFGCGARLFSDRVMSSDITECAEGVVLEADGITLDCNGHSISGTGRSEGIAVSGRSNIQVVNCEVSGFTAGIMVTGGAGNRVENNKVHDNENFGIYLSGTGEGNLLNNRVYGNGQVGIKFTQVENFDVTTNNICGNTGSFANDVMCLSSSGLGGVNVFDNEQDCSDLVAEKLACADDVDEDGTINAEDNCLLISNAEQLDSDEDGIGDLCEADRDTDGDGIIDLEDPCPDDATEEGAAEGCQYGDIAGGAVEVDGVYPDGCVDLSDVWAMVRQGGFETGRVRVELFCGG